MIKAIVVAAAAMLAAGGASAHGFTFRDAEFLSDDTALEQAQAFVADRLPAGLPLTEARARLATADMRCGRGVAAVTCDLGMIVHIDGGLLGEDHWRVRLTADADGRLTEAAVDHYIVGTGVPGLH